MARLVVGLLLAQGRRTVTSWLRAAGIANGYRSYYYFLNALGHKAQAIGLILLRLSIARLAIGDRLTFALDDTPTKRHGPADGFWDARMPQPVQSAFAVHVHVSPYCRATTQRFPQPAGG